MTKAVILGLTIQAVAVIIMHIGVRGQWLRHFGAILLLMAVLYHGVTEVVQWIWPDRNFYRTFVPQGLIDAWVILVSVGMLLFTVGYLLLKPRTEPIERDEPPEEYIRGLNLKWLLVLTVPVVLATVQGRGTIQTATVGAVNGRSNYAAGGLALQFLTFLVAVTAAVAIVRFGARWILLFLLVEVVVLGLAGGRLTVLTAVVATLYGAALAGVRVSRKQLIVAASFVAMMGIVISSTRGEAGRAAFLENQTLGTRVSAIGEGVRALPTERGREAVLNDVIYRFDGNSFGALVYDDLRQGSEPVGLITLRNGLIQAVPSFMYPDKLTASLEVRNEETYLIYRFGLPPTIDYLPGLFATLLAYAGPGPFLAVMLLLGMAFARLDAWIFTRSGRTLFLLGIGMTVAVVAYEQSVPIYIITLRGVLLIMAVTWVAGLVARRRMLLKPSQSLDVIQT